MGGRNGSDRGRAAVAAVEEAALGGTDADVAINREELHARISLVVGGQWWQTCGPPVAVTTPRHSTRSSTARSRAGDTDVEIRLADGQLTAATVAHELAHALAGVAAGHGPRFRIAHVDVIALLCGSERAATLAATYESFGLLLDARVWPAPWRFDGDSFRVVV